MINGDKTRRQIIHEFNNKLDGLFIQMRRDQVVDRRNMVICVQLEGGRRAFDSSIVSETGMRGI